MAAHPNVERARRGFQAFAEGDAATSADTLHENVVWRIPGRNPLAGEFRGRAEALGALQRAVALTDGTYRAELAWAVGDDEHVVASYRASGRRGEREIDMDQLLVIRIEDGRWADVQALPFDQHEFDAFWS